MKRKVNHKHTKIRELKVIQYIDDDERSKTIKNGESFELDTSIQGTYFLEFRIPNNRYCTIDFDTTYDVKKFTRKKSDDNPQNDRIIFKVESSSESVGKFSDFADDEDVDIKNPDDVPVED